MFELFLIFGTTFLQIIYASGSNYLIKKESELTYNIGRPACRQAGALGSGSSGRKAVRVQIPPSAPFRN